MAPEISMYDWLKGHDVYTWLEPLWSGGRWFINLDGKIQPVRTQIAVDTPWVHHTHQEHPYCFMGQTLFNTVSRAMKQHFSDGETFVPSGCQNCYKVVVRPKTLVQLFALNELEERLEHPSKCGIEMRPSVGALYGGYFYNQGIKEGQECYQKVRQAVTDDLHLGPDVAVILKRACTEMEHAVGPSDKWTVTEEQKVVEELCAQYLELDRDLNDQPEPVIWRTKRKWIEWAFAHGDETYKQFTGGKSITPGYVLYAGG